MTNTIRNIWDNLAGRVALCAVTFGWLPFYMLMAAKEALVK